VSDVIFLTEDQRENCDDCGDTAICLDGIGDFLCGYCAHARYGELQ